MRLAYAPYRLHFKQPSGTSRGVLTEKVTCFLKFWDEADPGIFGIGEAAVFEGLSPEANERFEYKLVELLANIALGRNTDLSQFSSIQFGLEQAIRDFSSGGKGIYFDSPFVHGNGEIQINGLVWMGSFGEMISRLETKIAEGFTCIKLKIGAIDWQHELEMVRRIRERFPADKLMIRVDANGGFSMDTALPRLAALADLQVHSIEQPIPARNYDLMKFLCEVSPLPIALDEDLIGVYSHEAKRRLVEYVHPAYLILKPALCGGFSGAEEWMAIADEFGVGYWVTSALESNVGLMAIAQWAATLDLMGPQGLGTGALFTNNFRSPVYLEGEWLRQHPESLDHAQFANLDWRE